MKQITPLVDELQRFCHGHLQRDRGAAASEMLAFLRQSWPEIPTVSLKVDAGRDLDAEALALGMVRDVGEVVVTLEGSSDLDAHLAWSRANLIEALKEYLIAVRS
jgi:hypothetical protein